MIGTAEPRSRPAKHGTLVYCGCCNTPILEVRGNSIIIKSRHLGREHVSCIPLEMLYNLASEQRNNS